VGSIFACAVLTIVALCAASSAFAITITFDGPIPAGGQQSYGNNSFYAEQSFKLTPTGFGMQRNDPNIAGPGWPDNGTIAMSVIITSFPILTYDFDEPFALLSIDLGEYSTVFADAPVSITVIGTTTLGDTLSTTFVTDGLIDGAGPLPDFEHVTFGSQWSNLQSVQFQHDSPFSMDNIEVALGVVPEPSTGLLLSLGLAAFATRRILWH
jgi:hypothetical protein